MKWRRMTGRDIPLVLENVGSGGARNDLNKIGREPEGKRQLRRACDLVANFCEHDDEPSDRSHGDITH
jgi:hypothetical protein